MSNLFGNLASQQTGVQKEKDVLGGRRQLFDTNAYDAIIETVFAWPGVGRLVVQAIFSRDYPLVQATVLVLAVIFVVVNLLVDLIYLYLDPQISYLEQK